MCDGGAHARDHLHADHEEVELVPRLLDVLLPAETLPLDEELDAVHAAEARVDLRRVRGRRGLWAPKAVLT